MKRINIGSGNRPMPDADNCDCNASCPGLTYVCELDAIPVPDNTYDEVWSIHSIEHVPYPRAATSVLAEWLRITKPGGVVSIDTPNLERNTRLYHTNQWQRDFDSLTPEEQERLKIDGVPDATLWVNFKMFSSEHLWDVHYWNASPDLLVGMCLRAGFSRAEVTQTDPSLIVKAYK
jgi:ubiquinone/menaquinone biosynthesis C-methylase UbiE